jgi:predicted DNA-binding transcriptional regulator AlpA
LRALTEDAPDVLLRWKDVERLIPMSRSAVDRRIARGLFPAPAISGRGVPSLWSKRKVFDWIRATTGTEG